MNEPTPTYELVMRLRSEGDELRAEIARLRKAFRHYHDQAWDLNDTACRKCGLDMRNPIHRREEKHAHD